MLPHGDTVMSIVSFVRGIFKTWDDGLGGKERARWECFRHVLRSWISNSRVVLAALVKGIWAGPGGGYGTARGTDAN